MALDVIFITLATILMILGIAGCILPALPGIPLNYAGIILLQLTSKAQFSHKFLIAWAIIVALVQVIDYYVPIWGTKKFGGSKYATRGSTIGIILGLFFFLPWGIIVLPFVGAIIGELIAGKNFEIAFKAGLGAFIGFIAGTLMKLSVALILTFYFIKEIVTAFF